MLILKKSYTREYGQAFRTSQESVGGSLLSQPIQSSKVNKCWTIACNDEEDLNYVWRFRCIDCWEALNWSFMRLIHRCICKNWLDLFHIPWSCDLQICACKNLPSCQGRLLSSPPIRGTFAGKWKSFLQELEEDLLKLGTDPSNPSYFWLLHLKLWAYNVPIQTSDMWGGTWYEMSSPASGVAQTPWSFTDWSPKVRAMQSPG